MDRSVGSPRTQSIVRVRGLGVSVFGLPIYSSASRFFCWARFAKGRQNLKNLSKGQDVFQALLKRGKFQFSFLLKKKNFQIPI